MGYGCRSHSLPRTTHGRRRDLARPGDSAVSVLHYGAPHLSTFLTISSLSAADVRQRQSAHSPHYYATVAISRLSAADVHRRRSAHSPHMRCLLYYLTHYVFDTVRGYLLHNTLKPVCLSN